MSGRRSRRQSVNGREATVNGAGGARRGGTEIESKKKRKLLAIHQALNDDPVDVRTLRQCAVSEGGLLSDEIRRKVWPKLLNVNVYDLPPKPRMRADQRAVLQEQLINVILYVLQRNKQLHYYQGYHDIVVTFLLVVGERMAIALMEILSSHHLRDFMDPTMDSTKHILNYLMPILEQVKPDLHVFMKRAEVGTIFALSWLITWYGHVLSEFRHTVRLYDFFLASHPLMPVYLAAAIVLHREQEVLKCECEMASVHQLLSKIPHNLPYEKLIIKAEELYSQYPPAELAKQAALQFHKSVTISTFQDFQLATSQQRPDAVLCKQSRERARLPPNNAKAPAPTGANQLVKMAVWGLTATLGAAAFAVVNTAMEWAPEFVFQLFP
ncbi:TBC1 domain family member 20 isoform X2 [Pristis pectinata]|uniref:TBC1 domain family member 20 isoform X2 n=1 Tax=Pristis pectinata TaxID=685728 RepID=UPI00223E46F1|nr:TBC1 domain family member 20 isoform X2 [Pristis pectinata]